VGEVEVRPRVPLLSTVDGIGRRSLEMMVLVLMYGLLPLPDRESVLDLGEIFIEEPRASDAELEPMPEDKSLEETGYDE